MISKLLPTTALLLAAVFPIVPACAGTIGLTSQTAAAASHEGVFPAVSTDFTLQPFGGRIGESLPGETEDILADALHLLALSEVNQSLVLLLGALPPDCKPSRETIAQILTLLDRLKDQLAVCACATAPMPPSAVTPEPSVGFSVTLALVLVMLGCLGRKARLARRLLS